MNTSKTLLTEDQVKVFEQTRYFLVNRLGWMFIAILTLVAIVNSLHPHYNAIPDIATIVMIGSCLFLLRKTKNYRLVSKIGVTGATITLITVLFTVEGLHLATPIWMMNCIVFTYLILEKFWGGLITLLNFGAVNVYLLTVFDDRMNSRFLIGTSDSYIFIVEFTVQAAALGYMLHVFLNASQTVQRNLTDSHRQVTDQNQLISGQKKQIEVMLKEIHHRVKNNLQIISSLLKLQNDSLEEDKSANLAMQEAVNRVNTMAMIHERMYKTDTFKQFDLNSYIENLVAYICDSYPIGTPVKAYMEVENFDVSTDTMVPLAMMINELTSNSIRHAFDRQEKPKIELKIALSDNVQFDFTYSDNGNWKDNTESFGSEIIAAMTEQLEGSKTLETNEEGTTYRFRLKRL